MTITVNEKAYVQDVPSSKDSVPYQGPSATLSVTDRIDLSRTYPKKALNFSGMGRSRIKFTRTLNLTGALTPNGLATIDVAVNIPVGAASADVDALLADVAAGLTQQWAKDLAKNLDLTA